MHCYKLTRTVAVLRRRGQFGENLIRLSRKQRRQLNRGRRYRAVIIAKDATGRRSRSRHVRFRVQR